MKLAKIVNARKSRRKARVRAKISGSSDRPRLSVFRSNRHMYAQLIDDEAGKTIAAASSKGKKGKSDAAHFVGEMIAKKALEMKIAEAVFDKGAYKYHGRVRAVCEAAKAAGLKI